MLTATPFLDSLPAGSRPSQGTLPVTASTANLIRNPDFAEGHLAPAHWQWEVLAGSPQWQRNTTGPQAAPAGIEIVAESPGDAARWTQRRRCRSQTWYRIELSLHVELDAFEPDGGFAVAAASYRGEQRLGTFFEFLPLTRTLPGHLWRGYYRTAAQATRLEVALIMRGARGRSRVEFVRVVELEGLHTAGHPLAVPPPPFAAPPPRRCHTVGVVSDPDVGPPEALITLLETGLGEGQVRRYELAQVIGHAPKVDAVLVPRYWPALRRLSWSQLLALARERLVIVPLEYLAAVTQARGRAAIRLRTLRQANDPLGAKVVTGSFLTHGLALEDVFPLCAYDRQAGEFWQRHLARGRTLKTLCRQRGLEVLLVNDANTDAASDHPIALFAPARGGGVLVMDLDLLFDPRQGGEDVNLASMLLYNALGWPAATLGQFVRPDEDYPREAVLHDFAKRFRPVRAVRRGPGRLPQILVGDPARTRTRVLIRTPEHPRHYDIQFGVLYFLKQLTRPERFACRYAPRLLERSSIVWEASDTPGLAALPHRHAASTESSSAFADTLLVDVRPVMEYGVRLVLPDDSGPYAPYRELIPVLYHHARSGRFVGRFPAQHAPLTHLPEQLFTVDEEGLLLQVDPQAFADPPAADVLRAGGRALRIEVPTNDDLSGRDSVMRTDRLAVLLELLIGMELGLVVVNRNPYEETILLPAPPPDASVRLWHWDGREDFPALRSPRGTDQIEVLLAPGDTLCVCRP